LSLSALLKIKKGNIKKRFNFFMRNCFLGKKICIFVENWLNKTIVMALEIKRAPVLRGKAARDFYKKIDELEAQGGYKKKMDESELQRIREYLSKQKYLI
jgi:hypothetical protein